MLWLVLLLFVVIPRDLSTASLVSVGQTDVDFQDACTQRCPFQNKTEEGDFDVGCGNDCKIEQCSRGCSSWQRALESSCPSVCNGTQELLPPKEMYCIMGCNDALNRYFQRLKDEIGTPPPPVLVADSLTATSLSLEWDGFKLSNISYLVQWRYEELAGSWQYCRNQSWGPHSTVRVENLQPYTKYRFRIALLLSTHHTEPLVSEPSVVISTLPSGTPQSAPTIVRATAVDSSHISVSWVPGPFPNGPILSYKLKIKELPEGYVALKDIPESENTAYLVRNLMANRNFSISVTMRNSVGEGPAATAIVMTPSEPAVKDTLQPILILGAPHAVIRQTADMLHEPSILYKTPHIIEGVAIHVNKHKLFVADSQGYVLSVDLGRFGGRSTILTPSHTNFKPLDLSVDWLNDQLYMLGQVNHSTGPMWQVARCGLDGRGLTIAMAGFLTRPLHIEVDPYNGYLFWVMQDSIRPGLYRLDLADISNGVKHEVSPDIILEDPNLGAFTVDHTNFRLLVANHTKNTVISVSLDGREVVDFRANTQQPMFREVLSIATANGLFYWTNGKEVMMEEYHNLTYFHNTLPSLSDRSFTSVSVNLPTSQPVPIPVNPPINVQAIFGTELAKTSWQVPHLVGGQGKGAWQNWSYEVRVHDEQLGVTIYKRDINATSYTIQNLKENTEYVIKAAAYTSSGIGPWSSEFRGKTLRVPKDGKYASILWSSSEGLLKSDVTGENVETLLHKSNLKDLSGDYHITDLAWYEDKLYLVTNSTHVYWYNLTSHDHGQLHEIDSVGSIAVDWIGRKLYWSNPKQQLITRGNLFGAQQEPLILTVAKELNIDSIHAYIYWSTGHAVECARLNGADKKIYYPEEIFSGKQVMGLTLDMDRRSVYWIVRSYEGSKLFKAPMAEEFFPRQKEKAVQIFNLQHPNIQGPLSYFSDHLLWLQDDRNAVIGDMSGQNTALISKMSLSGLNMAAVVDPALHHTPNSSYYEVNVIPEPVNPASIRITGTWNSFIIEWDSVNNVNYDQVFYEVTIEDSNRREIQPVTTLDHYVVYEEPEKLQPHSKLQVTINAYTYWGTSPQVRVLLHSPPSVPSQPTNPRVFVSYVRSPIKGDQDIEAAFRWDPPTHPNGVIEGYHVNCWFTSQDKRQHTCDSYHLDLNKLEYTANNLRRNSTYYFQVQAHTQVGRGNMTDLVRADTDVEMPVPKLLLSTADAVKITDCDKHDNQTLSRSSGPPVDLAFMSHENRIFWLSEMKELLGSNLDGHNRTKILTLNGSGLSITVDWVGRYVYWAESDEKIASSVVYRLDLNQAERGRIYATKVLHRPNLIYTLNVSPFRSTLFWIEASANGLSYLMTSHSDGTASRPFFTTGLMNRKRRESFMMEYCTCPENPPVGQAMTIDHTDPANPKILWVDGWHNHVLSADASGCNCNLVVNASINGDAGLPPTSLTTDQRLVYWSNASEGRVYSVAKNSEDKEIASLKKGVTSVDISGVQRITALGPHLQPFPVPHCLSPQQVVGEPQLVNRTAQSVTLELPHPKRLPECDNISLASVQYTVYYTLLQEDRTTDCSSLPDLCSKMVTYDHIVEISNLKPYSSYVFYISLKNYYSEMEGIQMELSPPSIFQTAAGAPSPPQNVRALVLSPNTVELRWLPPNEFNDETIHYEVHWRTEGMVSGLRHKGELLIELAASAQMEQRAELQKLLAEQTYSIWVHACSQNSNTCSNSDQVVVTTYPEPDNITMLSTTAYSANISWNPSPIFERFDIQCIEISTATVVVTVSSEAYPTGTKIFTIYNLRPKKLYALKLSVLYPLSIQPYVWPSDERFVFETQGDRPSPPGTPLVQPLRWDVYQVTWEQSTDNGGHLELYSLEARFAENQREHKESNLTSEEDATSVNDMSSSEEWVTYYNGTDNYWIISELSPSMKYIFRVRARNKYGWSEYSETSESFDFTEAAKLAEQQELGIVLGISIPIVVFVLCVIGILAFMYVFRRREKEKKALQVMTLASVTRGPDVELATLRELPRRGNFVHNTNALYTTADIPTDEEMALLPHIRRDQITLTKFLGSGAFGEVFEGNAKNLADSNGAVTRVAIKTLRKGATEQEKAEFLKEAQLMSNFKHEHILQLLGVCLDNDPNFIIMELMESGDLLSYLRSSRPHIYSSNALTLLDLLAMCVDVARGCRYLEEMHFVHRDLACRNCLVSSSDPCTRVVKIGDFGLARDIYKNDYYRKEGEGLLPVRWMAPESLVDGVFTCQSDVWAFGVLIWEIMTLGQQPYPARTNLEVLHYVRNGGRLGRPSNCPEELHQLMLKTWSYNPEHRPTFKYCLDVLEELKNKSTDIHLSAIQNGHYVSRTRNGGIDNRGFFEDENHNNSSGSSWKTGSDEGSRDHIPFLQSSPETTTTTPQPPQGILTESHNTSPTSTEPHRYLELIYDSDTATTVSDGYEIPRSLPAATITKSTTDRPRTFSTSSTMSDGSASTSQSCQHAPSVCSTIDEVIVPLEKTENVFVISDIKSNGCIGGVKKNTVELRRNGEKDLSTLEQLLPAMQKCTNIINGQSNTEEKSSSISNLHVPVPYSNLSKQPLLQGKQIVNSGEATDCLPSAVTIKQVHSTVS